MRLWLVLLGCALAIGAAWGAIAPETWGFGPADGLLLGSALYMAAWKRFVERREAWLQAWAEPAGARGTEGAREIDATGASWSGLLAALSLRAALFILLVCIQAFLCFQMFPEADVRRGFILLSAWIVMQALIDAGSARSPIHARANEASRPPSR